MSAPPRLTYLISGLDIGGAEVGMVRLLNGLDPHEFDVTVVALHGGDRTVVRDLPDHVDVIDLRIENKLAVYRLLPLIPILARSDILVGSIYHAEVLSRLLGTLVGVETLLTWAHNEQFKTPVRRWVDQLTIGLSDSVIADSEAVAEMLRTVQGADPEFIRILPIAGVSPDEFDLPARSLRRIGVTAEAGVALEHVDDETTVVGTVGTLIEQKNHDAVLDVAARLEDSDVHFAIAGDGPRKSDLITSIHERELMNVSLLGYVESVPDFLSAVDIYFQPSLYEGLCITVVEAMAAGKPVVASEVGQIARNVRHGTDGFLAAPADVDRFERYLRRLVSNADQRNRMGEAGRNRVIERYSQQALTEGFRSLIADTYDGGGRVGQSG